MKKGFKILLIVLGVLLAVIVVVMLLAAPVAKNYVNKHGQELVGRNLHVDGLKLNLLTGHVALHNLALYEEDNTTVFVSFDTLDVKAKLLKALSNEIHIKHITLAGLSVNVWQQDTVFNFTSLLNHFASNEPKMEDTTSSNWKLSFYNIRLSHGKVYYEDRTRHCDWRLKDLNIKVPGFCIGGEEAADAGLTIELADGGTLSTDAHYDMQSNDFTASLSLSDFALQNVKPYLTDFVRVGYVNGKLNAQIEAVGNVSHLTELVVKGNVTLADVDLQDEKDNTIAALNRLAVELNAIDLGKNSFDVANVEINGLQSRLDLYEEGNNITRLLVASAPADTTAPAPDAAEQTSKPMQLVVRHFAFTDGAVTYADHTLPDEFEFPITKIRITADNLTLTGNNAARVMASLPNGGHAFIDWQGSLDDIQRSQNLVVSIKDLQLKDLSPYTVAYLAHPFDDGVFSFVSRNSITEGQLEGNNYLDIYKAVVGKKRKEVDAEIKIPLKAALYVLKDKDEKIQIDMPISGDLNNPEFKYMKVVWKTLGNLFVKVATEPFRLAGNALGLGKRDDNFIAIDPNQYDITSEQYYELDKYADVALQSPTLLLTLDMQIDEAADSTQLQLAEMHNKQVYWHLTEEKHVPKNQIEIKTTMVPSLKKMGYIVDGKLQEVEE